MIDWNTLKQYIGKKDESQNELIESCYNDAVALLALATVSTFRPIPEGIMDRMVLEVGQDLFDRKNAPSGTSMYATYDGGSVPVRSPRDPLNRVRNMLAMFVVPF